MEHLSPLERELLDCVQQLTDASVRSNEALSDLEKRSTGLLNERLERLETCLSASINLQAQFNAGLLGLLTDPASYNEHSDTLNNVMNSIAQIQSKINGGLQ
ncbi:MULTISPECIES: hypothetical protein [Stappiaceae]|uniref:Uncharacterized protein n=1 Tax=Pseudovibrio exalbescens TaxID=197461 RepID=A0A1U7JL58_9HYPH|nr:MULTISPECIES: hypothetical protein [Pseudovibrio]MDX5591983.1 hypothetical protein [Pseudovibrio sp. SPO723]OKL45445.1 hypothetical protein A3843_03750 [Pseudovibrio exalbescens]